jgi:RecJ-like exonuclease
MIEVSSLEESSKSTDVRPGSVYIGRYSAGFVYLTGSIKGKIVKSGIGAIEENSEVLVKVLRVSLPGKFDLEAIERANQADFRASGAIPEFSEISEKHIGKKYSAKCVVERVMRDFPAVLMLSDGTASIKCRVPKEINLEFISGGSIRAELSVSKDDDGIFLDALKIEKILGDKAVKVRKEVDTKSGSSIRESSEFSINSERLSAMKKSFLSVAEEIKRAIVEERPIVLRHHSDCDGYSGALSLERAILPLIERRHRGVQSWMYYKRFPNRSPYYDYSDALRDLSSSLSERERFSLKPPLFLLVDFGVSGEELYIIRHLKLYDIKVIIIDHHELEIDEKEKDEYLKILSGVLNPHLCGFDGSITAGMLSFELSRFINSDVSESFLLPALSGISDKSSCAEADSYLDAAKKEFSHEFIKSLAECIDFEAYTLGPSEARRVVSDFFFDLNLQKRLVSIVLPEVRRKKQASLNSAISLAKTERIGKVNLATIDLSGMPRQDYPPVGRIAGMCFDELSKNHGAIVLFCTLSDSIIIRSGEELFSVSGLVSHLKEKLGLFGIDGGGHSGAGTVRFFSFAKEKVLSEARAYLEKL